MVVVVTPGDFVALACVAVFILAVASMQLSHYWRKLRRWFEDRNPK